MKYSKLGLFLIAAYVICMAALWIDFRYFGDHYTEFPMSWIIFIWMLTVPNLNLAQQFEDYLNVDSLVLIIGINSMIIYLVGLAIEYPVRILGKVVRK